jgi:hypothetical protein
MTNKYGDFDKLDIAIAENMAQGLSQRATARELGLKTHTTVNDRLKKKPKLQELIRTVQESVINEGLELAKENIVHAIQNYKKPQTLEIEGKKVFDWQLREHGFKASQAVLQSAGVLSGPGIAVQINNIYNDNRQEIPEVILEYLKNGSNNVIDANYEDLGGL